MYTYEELALFGSGYGLLESPFECGVESPGSINHGIIIIIIIIIITITIIIIFNISRGMTAN